MTKKNYQNYSKPKTEETQFKAAPVEAEETVEAAPVEETVRTGLVTANKLNVRCEPDTEAKVLCVIDGGTIVTINEETPQFFGVLTEFGAQGYCMKQFIDIQ